MFLILKRLPSSLHREVARRFPAMQLSITLSKLGVTDINVLAG